MVQLKFEAGGNNEENEMGCICDSVVYYKELEVGHLPGLYYFISWKGYPEDKSTWELALLVQHLQKLVSTFYKDQSSKLTVTSPPIDLATPMAKHSVLLNINSK